MFKYVVLVLALETSEYGQGVLLFTSSPAILEIQRDSRLAPDALEIGYLISPTLSIGNYKKMVTFSKKYMGPQCAARSNLKGAKDTVG